MGSRWAYVRVVPVERLTIRITRPRPPTHFARAVRATCCRFEPSPLSLDRSSAPAPEVVDGRYGGRVARSPDAARCLRDRVARRLDSVLHSCASRDARGTQRRPARRVSTTARTDTERATPAFRGRSESRCRYAAMPPQSRPIGSQQRSAEAAAVESVRTQDQHGIHTGCTSRGDVAGH